MNDLDLVKWNSQHFVFYDHYPVYEVERAKQAFFDHHYLILDEYRKGGNYYFALVTYKTFENIVSEKLQSIAIYRFKHSNRARS